MFELACSPMNFALQPRLAWTEGRALLRSNPSAAPGAKTGVGIGSSGPIPLAFFNTPGLAQGEKPRRHDAVVPSARCAASYLRPTAESSSSR